jgi:hypothetical protein
VLDNRGVNAHPRAIMISIAGVGSKGVGFIGSLEIEVA